MSVRIVLEQPAAARFLVRKLYHFLVSEKAVPPDSLLEPLCESFRKSDYDIAGLVRTILASRHFYSDHAFRQRVKGPVEYVLGAVQTVYRRYGEQEAEYRSLPQRMLVSWLGAMGQHLFAPPNVKGWPGGPSWMNTSTVLERDNFAAALAMGTLWSSPTSESTAAIPAANSIPDPVAGKATPPAAPAEMPEEPAPPLAFESARILAEERVSCPEDVVRALLDLYLPGGVRSEVRAKLVAFVADGQALRTRPGPPRARGRPCHPFHRGISTGVSVAHLINHGVPDMFNRRQFLTHTLKGSSLVALSSLVPQFVSRTAQAAAPGKDTILVVLEMTGGNDGLNTVIPYADDLYHKARPTLRQTKDVVIRLDDHVGLHSGMQGFRPLWEKGQLAVVQGVGYPNPERSHFEAMDTWQSGRYQGNRKPAGWAGPRRRTTTVRVGYPFCTSAQTACPGLGRGAGWRGGHRQRAKLLPPRAGWRQRRSTEGPPQAAGGPGVAGWQGCGRPGNIRTKAASANDYSR